MPSDIQPLTNYSVAFIEETFSKLRLALESDAASIRSLEEVEAFRLRWDGRKQGRLPDISGIWIKQAPDATSKKLVGEQFALLKARFANELHRVKHQVEVRTIVTGFEKADPADLAVLYPALREATEELASSKDAEPELQADLHKAVKEIRRREVELRRIDITLPGIRPRMGVEHPLIKTMHEIVGVFQRMGYSVCVGPEVENDFNNFESLNFPPNHPARDTQDTLVIADQEGKPLRERLLMRTHTSPVQIRTMLEQAPPLRIVIPGKVHRNEAADATHSPVFHQVEGLCVDTNITFSDLKGTLDHAMKAFFGSSVKTRFFPSFFPFTEPSADVQISCIFCNGKGCRKCKHSGWIELLGCGMIDPAVFAAVNQRRIEMGREPVYDTQHISGFAFGMGVDRIAMMKYGISDIGLLYSGDLRFLEQFA